MALMTKFGGFWGFIPQISGRVFFVAPSDTYTVEGQATSASDENDGLSPDRAVRTVNRAIALATASVGDIIVLLPGAHSVSATIAVSKAGLTITGIPSGRPYTNNRMPQSGKRARTTVTSTQTAGIIFTVSAVDTEISHLTLLPPAAGGRGISLAPLSGAANRAFIHDVSIIMSATASTTTYGITVPAGVTADLLEDVHISHCYFQSGGAASSGANGPAVNVLATAHGLSVENSTFELKGTAAWADAILSSNAGTLGLSIVDCDFKTPTSATTVITDAIDVTGQTVDGSTLVLRCYFPAGTDALEGSATPDVNVAESYTADATSGTIVAK